MRNPTFLCLAFLAVVTGILLHEALPAGKALAPADGIFLFPPWQSAIRSPMQEAAVPAAKQGQESAEPAVSNYLLDDQYLTLHPLRHFLHQRIRAGDFPLWNPLIACGVPFLASMQAAALFPIHLLLSPVDPFHASAIAAFLKIFLAGVFTLLYLRSLGASRTASVLAGVTFALSGFMIVWLGHPHVNCALWLPLLFYFVEKGLHDARRWAAFALAYGCMLLGGHSPTIVHVTLAVSAYFIFRLCSRDAASHAPRSARPLPCSTTSLTLFAAGLAIGVLLAAPQILPFLEYFGESSMAESSGALQRWSSRLPFVTFLHFFLPYLGGSPVTGFEQLGSAMGFTFDANFNERIAYVGILPLFLAAVALRRRREKTVLFHATLAVLSLAAVYGVPPLPSLFSILPVLSSINPTRLLLLTGFSLAVLAGLGLDAATLARHKPRAVPQNGAVRSDSLCSIRALTIGFCLTAFGCLVIGFFLLRPQMALTPGSGAFLLRQMPVFLGGVVLSAYIGLFRLRGRDQPKHAGDEARWYPRMGPQAVMLLCLGWTAFDLLWFGTGYNPAVSRAQYYPETGAVSFLRRDPGLFRIIGGGRVLLPNTGMMFGLHDVRGQDFMTVKRYEKLITGRSGDFNFYSVALRIPRILPALNVKYILTKRGLSLPADRFERVYDGEIRVYRVMSYTERAIPVFKHEVLPRQAILTRMRSGGFGGFDPGKVLLLEEEPELPSALGGSMVCSPTGMAVEGGAGEGLEKVPPGRKDSTVSDAEVRILENSPDELLIRAAMPRPGFLLLLDTYFPGWKATVNGRPARIHRADYNFRAVVLPAGVSSVRFSYTPASFRIGVWLALAALCCLSFVFFGGWTTVRAKLSRLSGPEAR